MPSDILQRFRIEGKDNSKRAFKSARGNVTKLSAVAKRALPVIAGLAGVGGLGALIKSAFDAGDEIGKMADRLGATTKGLAAIGLAAKLAGSPIETTHKAMEKMVRSLGDISQNLSSTQVKVFEQLGLSIDEFAKMKADEQFEKLSIAISGLPTQMAKASAASQLFGRSGTQMLNVMEGVSSNIQQAKDETERFGTALTRVEIAKLEAANDAAARTGESIKGIANVIAISLAPALESSFDGMTDFFVDVRQGIEKTIGFVDRLANELIRVGLISGDTEYVEAKKREVEWTAKLKQAEKELGDARKNADTTMHIYGTETGDVALDAAHSRVERAKKMLAEAVADVKAADAAIDAVLSGDKTEGGAVGGEGGDDGGEDGEDTPAAKSAKSEFYWQQIRLQRWKEYWQAKADAEEELRVAEAERKEEIENADEQAEYNRLERLREKYREYWDKRAADEKKAAELRRKIEEQTTTDTINTVKYLGQALGRQSKAGFKLTKAAGIAEAIINTHKGITKALELPFPANLAAAAVTAAKGFASVAAIQSTSFGGGGGSGGSSSGGGSSLPIAAALPLRDSVGGQGSLAGVEPAAQRKDIVITASGNRFTAEEVGDLISQIAEATGDNVTANIGAAA